MNSKSLIILAAIITSVFAAPTNSPCPSVFNYEPQGDQTDRWYGEIQISSDVTLTGIFVGIVLDRKAHLLGNYFGEAFTTDNQDYTIRQKNIKIKPGEIKRLRFFIKYNEAETIPEVKAIRLNGRNICLPQNDIISTTTTDSSPPLYAGTIRCTTDAVSHVYEDKAVRGVARISYWRGVVYEYISLTRHICTVKPPLLNPPPTQQEDENESMDYFGGDIASPIILPVNKTSNVQKCGIVSTKVVPLIAGGSRTLRGDWPWHAALYQTKGTDLTYICGGSLISNTAIVTAAHCVSRQFSRGKVDPQSLLVFLGKHNLRRWFPEEQSVQISDVIIHPDYSGANYQADVAILKFEKPVTFDNLVKPICLWDPQQSDLNTIINKIGTVVGWGYDESGTLSDELSLAEMPVVDKETCIRSNVDFFSKFSNNSSYCAGFRNGTTVCNGDSGGGMFFSSVTSDGDTQWRLRGLVSLSAPLRNESHCNTKNYVVFTDLAKYITWILRNMSEQK